MSTTVNTSDLIAEQVSSLLVQPLEAASIVLSNGVRVFDSAEPLRIPTMTAGFTPTAVAEATAIPVQDAAFSQINLMPSNRTSFKVITKISAELARQSHVNLDAVLKERLVGDVARAVDTALLSGTGASNGITGLLNQAGTQDGVLDNTDPDSLLDGLALLHAAEVEPTHVFLSGADFLAFRKIKATVDGRYLIEPNMAAGAGYTLFGHRLVVSNKIPTGKAIVADMSKVAVVRDIAPSVTVLDQTYASTDEIGIRVVTRYDLGLLNPEAVAILTDAA